MVNQSANRRLIWKIALVPVFMFGFGFALVPLYDVFCRITGLNGKTGGPVEITESLIDYDRVVELQFIAVNNEGMSWEFAPEVPKMELHPGAIQQVVYQARNPTGEVMVGQAIPSVSPSEAAEYLKKIQCFCFERQELQGQASADMPLVFVIDNNLPGHIKKLTLSYTLFDVTKQAKPKNAMKQS